MKAGQLVRNGAVGRVIQTVGLGPHRVHPHDRPARFCDREQSGGILVDIASHQAEHFLFFTGSTRAEVVAAQVANYGHPDYPEFEDFSDAVWGGWRDGLCARRLVYAAWRTVSWPPNWP